MTESLYLQNEYNIFKFYLTLRTRAYALCPRVGTVKTGSQNRPQKTQEIVTSSEWAFSRLSDDVQIVMFHTYMYRWEIIIHEEYDKIMSTV